VTKVKGALSCGEKGKNYGILGTGWGESSFGKSRVGRVRGKSTNFIMRVAIVPEKVGWRIRGGLLKRRIGSEKKKSLHARRD